MPVYKLRTPRKVGDALVEQIEFDELDVDQVIELAELDTADLRTLKTWLAQALKIDAGVIGALTIGDFKGLVDAVTGPLPDPPGGTPSPSPPN